MFLSTISSSVTVQSSTGRDTVCEEWYSIHIDGADGLLTVKLAFRDHLDTFEILLFDCIFSRLVSCFEFVEAKISVFLLVFLARYNFPCVECDVHLVMSNFTTGDRDLFAFFNTKGHLDVVAECFDDLMRLWRWLSLEAKSLRLSMNKRCKIARPLIL